MKTAASKPTNQLYTRRRTIGKGKKRISTKNLQLTSAPNFKKVTVELTIPLEHVNTCGTCNFEYMQEIEPVFPYSFVQSRDFFLLSIIFLAKARKVLIECIEKERNQKYDQILEEIFAISDMQNGQPRQSAGGSGFPFTDSI